MGIWRSVVTLYQKLLVKDTYLNCLTYLDEKCRHASLHKNNLIACFRCRVFLVSEIGHIPRIKLNSLQRLLDGMYCAKEAPAKHVVPIEPGNGSSVAFSNMLRLINLLNRFTLIGKHTIQLRGLLQRMLILCAFWHV